MNHKLNLKKQLACIYTNNFFSGLRITDAVWVALLAARGFSLWEIGVAESVFHMVSLTCWAAKRHSWPAGSAWCSPTS